MTWLYMPSVSAPGSADSTSPCANSEWSAWATSSGTPTLRPSSWRGWKKRPWIALLSGLTLPPSILTRGAEEWISSVRAIRASRFLRLFTAAEAGAPHRRERLFVLAYRDVAGLRRLWSDRLLDSERASFGHDAYGRSGSDCALVDAHGPRLEKRGEGAHEGREEPGRGHEAVGDAGLARLKGRMPTESRGRRWPPGPSDRVEWARVLDRDPLLAPAVSPLCGVAHGAAGRLDADGRAAVFADRVDRLRCLGNAVSPDQAVLAIQELVRRALT